MGDYKTFVTQVPHDFNDFVLLIDGDHIATGLQSISAEYDDDKHTVSIASDGHGTMNRIRSKSGNITFAIASSEKDTTAKLNALYASEAYFPLSVTCIAAPDLKWSGAHFQIQKQPAQSVNKEIEDVEFVCVAVYMDIKGGGYKEV